MALKVSEQFMGEHGAVWDNFTQASARAACVVTTMRERVTTPVTRGANTARGGLLLNGWHTDGPCGRSGHRRLIANRRGICYHMGKAPFEIPLECGFGESGCRPGN